MLIIVKNNKDNFFTVNELLILMQTTANYQKTFSIIYKFIIWLDNEVTNINLGNISINFTRH